MLILVSWALLPSEPLLNPTRASYNIRQRDVAVFDIAYQRAVSVAIGVVWAAIVSRYWWPAEARRQLSRALGEYVV